MKNPPPGGRLSLDAIPDAAVRDEIIRHVNGALLQPICETVITRSASELALKDGTRAELALDVGEIHAEGRSAALREVEIELIEGRLGGLFDIAHALFADGGLLFSRLTKSARGYLLAEQGYVDPPLVPRNAQGFLMRLDNFVAASPDGFSRASTSSAPRRWPKPSRSTHQVREAME